MNKKYILAIIFIACFTPHVRADSLLTISPNPYDLSLNTSVLKTINLNITNNHNFTIYNISFEDKPETDITLINSLGVGQTIIIPMNVITQEATVKTINSLVKYNYLSSITSDPVTSNINIQHTLFSPNSITIKQGDSIRFNNIDSNSHQISSSLFTQTIASNNNFVYQFTNQGNYVITDNDFGFTMNIQVISNTQQEQIHNPDYDYIWTLNLNSQYSQTSITIELIPPTTYTLNNFQQTEGALRITNNGNELAKNVDLTNSKWITFTSDNFDLPQGSSKIVTYQLQPQATIRNETGINNNIVISAKAINSPQVSNSIDVYVNLDTSLPENDLRNLDPEELLNLLLQALDKIQAYNQTLLNQTGNITVEQSRSQVNTLFNAWIQVRDYMLQDQIWKSNAELRFDRLENKTGTIKEDNSNFQNKTLTNYQEQKDKEFSFMFIFIALMISASAVVGLLFYKKYNKEKVFENQNWGISEKNRERRL